MTQWLWCLRVFLILVCVFEEFPSGRHPNCEVAAAAAAVNGASRLHYSNPRQGQTRGGSGGSLSLLSPETWQRRWIKLASTGIYKHRESVSEVKWLGCKAVCTGIFLEESCWRIAWQLPEMSVIMFNILLKALKMKLDRFFFANLKQN